MHRFAHKPIDELHRPRLLRFGRWWLCRGCSALVSGALVAVAALLLVAPSLLVAATMVVAGLGASLPRVYARLPNPARDLVRAGSGAGVVWAVAAAARGGGPLDALFILWSVVVLAWLVQRVRRAVQES